MNLINAKNAIHLICVKSDNLIELKTHKETNQSNLSNEYNQSNQTN